MVLYRDGFRRPRDGHCGFRADLLPEAALRDTGPAAVVPHPRRAVHSLGVAVRKASEDEIDPLFELPLSEFVAARNAIAKKLTQAGDKAKAEEVKKLGTRQGGEYVDGIRFTYQGGQIRSLLSLLSYFGKGEMRERSLGIKIPPTNLQPDFVDQAQEFANKLADSLAPSAPLAEARSSPGRDA